MIESHTRCVIAFPRGHPSVIFRGHRILELKQAKGEQPCCGPEAVGNDKRYTKKSLFRDYSSFSVVAEYSGLVYMIAQRPALGGSQERQKGRRQRKTWGSSRSRSRQDASGRSDPYLDLYTEDSEVSIAGLDYLWHLVLATPLNRAEVTRYDLSRNSLKWPRGH